LLGGELHKNTIYLFTKHANSNRRLQHISKP